MHPDATLTAIAIVASTHPAALLIPPEIAPDFALARDPLAGIALARIALAGVLLARITVARVR